MIKTGIHSKGYFDLEEYERGLEKLKSHGYDCVDCDLMNPNLSFARSEKEYETFLTKLGNFAKKTGVEVFQSHGLWHGDMVADTQEKRKNHIEIYKKQLRGAGYLQCKNLVIHPCMPCGWWGQANAHDEILAYQLDELFSLIPTAEEYGVTICVENMPLGIATTEYIKEVVEKVNHKCVKACFDTGHAHIQKEDILKSVRLLGKDLRVLHVHDNNGVNDLHAFPFTYSVDFKGFIKGLNEIKYQGCMSLETHVDLQTPEPTRTQMQQSLSKIARTLAQQVGE